MSTVYGYARCSTDITRQDIDRQKRKLLDIVQLGDTIACTEVSRLTRSTRRLCEILEIVQDRHLRPDIGGAFSVDCRTEDMDPMTKGMLMMWGVFAEMERDIISQRVKSGPVNARAKGKTPNAFGDIIREIKRRAFRSGAGPADGVQPDDRVQAYPADRGERNAPGESLKRPFYCQRVNGYEAGGSHETGGI